MSRGQINLRFLHGGADVARVVEVVVIGGDIVQRDALGVAGFFAAALVGLDDFVNVFGQENVLAFAFLEVFGGVDEEDVVGASCTS